MLSVSSQGPVSTSQASAAAPGKKEGKSEEGETRKWAIPVDITSPCEDFYKRVPDPAFKVPVLTLGLGIIRAMSDELLIC